MMSRADAIAWIRDITSGAGIDRTDTPVLAHRGQIAVEKWDDPLFTYGLEYGALIALCKAFDIDMAELTETVTP